LPRRWRKANERPVQIPDKALSCRSARAQPGAGGAKDLHRHDEERILDQGLFFRLTRLASGEPAYLVL